MKDVDEMIRYLLMRISQVYLRPMLCSYQARGIMMALHCYHELWAVITDRSEDFWSIRWKIHEEENCGPLGFDGHYKLNLAGDDGSSEAGAIAYVIRQYRRIDERLGVVLPEPRFFQAR